MLHVIACPKCQHPLNADAKIWRCSEGHSYDVARQGYLNLLLAQHKNSKAPGDTQEMVDARQRILDSQLYQPISDWLNQQILEWAIPQNGQLQIADIGCGEGYYTQRLEQLLQDHQKPCTLYGVDISKQALKRAAKRSEDILWLVASGGQLPFLPNSIDLLLGLFTTLIPQGFAKVLKPGAQVIMLNTGLEHLLELRQQIYEEVNLKAFDPTPNMLAHGFTLSDTQTLKYPTKLKSSEQIIDLLQMTPHWWKTSEAALNKLKQLDELNITIDIMMHQFTYAGA